MFFCLFCRNLSMWHIFFCVKAEAQFDGIKRFAAVLSSMKVNSSMKIHHLRPQKGLEIGRKKICKRVKIWIHSTDGENLKKLSSGKIIIHRLALMLPQETALSTVPLFHIIVQLCKSCKHLFAIEIWPAGKMVKDGVSLCQRRDLSRSG